MTILYSIYMNVSDKYLIIENNNKTKNLNQRIFQKFIITSLLIKYNKAHPIYIHVFSIKIFQMRSRHEGILTPDLEISLH